MGMLKKDINFVDLQKIMQENGYNYSLDTIRHEVGRGSYAARFLYEFADSLRLDIRFSEKE